MTTLRTADSLRLCFQAWLSLALLLNFKFTVLFKVSFFSKGVSSRQLLYGGSGLMAVFAYFVWSNSDIQWLDISARCINHCTKQYFSERTPASASVKALSKVPLGGR